MMNRLSWRGEGRVGTELSLNEQSHGVACGKHLKSPEAKIGI